VYEIAILKCTLNSTDQLEQYHRDRDIMEKELTMLIKSLPGFPALCNFKGE